MVINSVRSGLYCFEQHVPTRRHQCVPAKMTMPENVQRVVDQRKGTRERRVDCTRSPHHNRVHPSKPLPNIGKPASAQFTPFKSKISALYRAWKIGKRSHGRQREEEGGKGRRKGGKEGNKEPWMVINTTYKRELQNILK